MIGLFRRLWAWLRTPRSGVARKAHPDLRPIDTDQIARELDLLELAKRLGVAGLPAPDAVTLSHPEAAVVQRVEKARQDYVDWADIRLRVVNENITREDVSRDITRARQADQEFVRKASSLLGERQALLRTLSEAAKARGEELKAFRQTHRLTREADFPEGASKFFRWAVLIALIAFEGLVNAQFFAQGVSTGLLGGAAYAMSLAFVNVGVAFVFGLMPVRYRVHRNPVRALGGWLALAAALALMTILGLGIAHLRDAMTADEADAAAYALGTLLSSPLQLRDLMSWGLLAISVCFAAVALYDGLTMDDPYPGYGAVTRRSRDANEALEVELADLREQLEELKNEELELLDTCVEKSQVSLRAMTTAIESKVAADSSLARAFRDADNALLSLIQKFRDENQIHRGTAPRPRYFDERVVPLPLPLPDFGVEKDQTALQAQEELLAVLMQELESIRARIQTAYNLEYDRLKPLNTQFAQEEAA